MKYKIKKITDKSFGKVYRTQYEVMRFGRDTSLISLGIMLPILFAFFFNSYFFLFGWVMLIILNPFKKEWRAIKWFDKYYKALYFIKNDEKEYETKYETKGEFVK